MRLDRPIGFLLLLWPTWWALWFAADGVPDASVLLIFTAGVAVMRAGGCVINDIADREFDRHVERTKTRPLASGELEVNGALRLFAILMIMAVGLVLLTNALTIKLSVVGVFLAASYPFMKRHTYFPQVYLGAAFGWSIPMAYAAQTGTVTPEAWLIFLATVLWATAYDTLYAMVDREDDLKIGVKSTAILFGELDRLAIGITQAMMLVTLYLLGEQANLGFYWLSGLGVATLLCIYQQWLIRNRDRDECFRAFLNNHWLGLVVFAGLALESIPMPIF
jgi:4-hydroxybenzoate polyprenyltransferase